MERSLEALEDDADFIESHVDAIPVEKYRSISFWKSQSNAVKIRMLRKLTGTPPSREMLERLNREIAFATPELRKVPLSGEVTLHLRGDCINIAGEPVNPAPIMWNWKSQPEIIWNQWVFRAVPAETPDCSSPDQACFDADLLPEILEISLPAPGERMSIFGSGRSEKVKKLRVDRHIPAEPPYPVIRANGEICWAVMVRHSAVAPAAPESRHIVRLEFLRKEHHI